MAFGAPGRLSRYVANRPGEPGSYAEPVMGNTVPGQRDCPIVHCGILKPAPDKARSGA